MVEILLLEQQSRYFSQWQAHLVAAGYPLKWLLGNPENIDLLQHQLKPNYVTLRVLLLIIDANHASSLALVGKLQGNKDLAIVLVHTDECHEVKTKGLNAGADACLNRRTDVAELIAVIGSVTRRMRIQNQLPPRLAPRCAGLHLDLAKRQLSLVDGIEIQLTRAEGIILHALAQQAPEPVSRRQLSFSLGQDIKFYDERKLEAIVSRLRRKIPASHNGESPIKAARGQGYQLLIEVKTE